MRTGIRLRFRAVAACLAIGLVVNFAIAWGCAIRAHPTTIVIFHTHPLDLQAEELAELDALRTHPVVSRASDNELTVGVERRIGLERRALTVLPYWNIMTRRQSMPRHAPMVDDDLFDLRIRAGWPCLAFEGRRVLATTANPSPAARSVGYRYESLLRIGSIQALPGPASVMPWLPRFLLPCRPMPLGFATNSVFFALLTWLIMFAPIAVRRALRRRRGLCERCAYPRGSSTVCSECGSPVNAHPERIRIP